jgi:hypothetical protein
VRFTLRPLVRFGRKFLHLETRARKVLHKLRLGNRRPERHFSAGLERTENDAEAMRIVEARILPLNVRGRAVIHVEQDGVVVRLAGAADDFENVVHEHLHPRIVQQLAIHPAEKLAVPRHDLGQ